METRGGTFMFGYRIIDNAGEVFSDDTVITSQIKTLGQVWNNEKQDYDKQTTIYFQGSCTEEAKKLINAPDSRISFNIGSIQRAEGDTYKCPTALKRNFVSGTQNSDLFITTKVEVFTC